MPDFLFEIRSRWPGHSGDGSQNTQLHFSRPLLHHDSSMWSGNSTGIQKLKHIETYRTGQPCLTLLQQIFVPDLDACQAMCQHCTHVIPILTQCRDWAAAADGENLRSATVFASVATAIAIEIASFSFSIWLFSQRDKLCFGFDTVPVDKD